MNEESPPPSRTLFQPMRGTDSAELPPQVANHRLIHRLGTGGHATVWLAEQLRPIARSVAVKVFHAAESGEIVLHWFRIEREALARLPAAAFPAIHDAGLCDDGRPFIAMELIEGERLDTWWSAPGRTAPEIAEVFARIARALSEAHRLGLVHLDLKPANILVAGWPDGARTPRILDFGLALPAGDPSHAAGSEGFTAPETTRGAAVAASADLYALGVMLRSACSCAAREAYPTSALRELAERCAACDPSLRPEDMRTVAEQLENLSRAMVRKPLLTRRRAIATAVGTASSLVAGFALLTDDRSDAAPADRSFRDGPYFALDIAHLYNAPRGALRSGDGIPAGRASFHGVPFLLGPTTDDDPARAMLCAWSGGMHGAIGQQVLRIGTAAATDASGDTDTGATEPPRILAVHLLLASMWGRGELELITVEVHAAAGVAHRRTLRAGSDIRDYHSGQLSPEARARQALKFGPFEQFDHLRIDFDPVAATEIRIVDDGAVGRSRALVFACTIELAP